MGPGIYVHIIETEEDVLTCYVGKSDSNISKRLGRHKESQDQGDESPLYCFKRAFPASQVHEKPLLRLPTPKNLKRTCKTLADDKSLKKLNSYPAWALTNTFNSMLEGALIAHFAASHGRHEWYDAQWDKIFGAKAREDLAGCNCTPGTESDFALKRWRYEPKDANGSKGVRTLEDLLPVQPAASGSTQGLLYHLERSLTSSHCHEKALIKVVYDWIKVALVRKKMRVDDDITKRAD